MATVTIGLPVYNGARFLDSALGSLSSQNFADLRILVSDNASTDSTPSIIEKWQARDSRITPYRQEKNIGGFANFRWVLENADSPWFAFSAYDDLWSEDFVERLFRAAETTPGATISVPRLVTMFENGSEDCIRPAPRMHGKTGGVARIRENLRAAHSGWYYGLFKTNLFRERLTKTIQVFPYDWGVDFLILLPYILRGEVAADDTAIYSKRLTPLSEERYRPKTARDQASFYRDALKECFRVLKDAPLSPMEKAAVLPALIRYARNVQKPKHILRTALREILS